MTEKQFEKLCSLYKKASDSQKKELVNEIYRDTNKRLLAATGVNSNPTK